MVPSNAIDLTPQLESFVRSNIEQLEQESVDLDSICDDVLVDRDPSTERHSSFRSQDDEQAALNGPLLASSLYQPFPRAQRRPQLMVYHSLCSSLQLLGAPFGF